MPSKQWVVGSNPTSDANLIDMKLETILLKTLRKVYDHELSPMEAFDILSEVISEEFDMVNETFEKTLEDLDF